MTRLACLLADLPLQALGRLLSDRVMQLPAAARQPGTKGLLETRHRPAPPALRPLGLGALFLLVRMTGAVLRETVKHGSVGAWGEIPPGLPY